MMAVKGGRKKRTAYHGPARSATYEHTHAVGFQHVVGVCVWRLPQPSTARAATAVRRAPTSSAPALRCTTVASRVSRHTSLEHKHKCTHLLCKSIRKTGVVISRLRAQGGSDGVASVELMVLRQELARVHYTVARLMVQSLQAAKHQEAETHFKQALHLYRKVEASRGTLRGATARAAAGKLADKAARAGLYSALIDLGQLYSFMCQHDDELHMYQEALQEVRGDIAHASTPRHFSRTLTAMGIWYLRQYNSQISNGAKGDKGRCTGAKALLEEALSIQRALSQYGIAADTLICLASAHGYLEMFDEARSTLKQALDLTRRCHGEEAKKWLYVTSKWPSCAKRRSRQYSNSYPYTWPSCVRHRSRQYSNSYPYTWSTC